MTDQLPTITGRGEIAPSLHLLHAVPALAEAAHRTRRRLPAWLAVEGGDGISHAVWLYARRRKG